MAMFQRFHGNNQEMVDKNSCRVCERRDNLLELFDYVNDASEDSLSSKLMQIANVQVRFQNKLPIQKRNNDNFPSLPPIQISCLDELPDKICKFCKIRLDYAFNLKKICETTDKKLRERLNEQKTMRKVKMIEELEIKHRVAVEEVIIQSPDTSIVTIKKTGIVQNDPIPCTACDEVLMGRKEFQEHIKTHGLNRHQCHHCGKWFRERR
jgi:hypothetical protein